MKRGTNITLLTITTFIFCISFIQAATFNASDISTWNYENLEEIKKLDQVTIDQTLAQLPPKQRTDLYKELLDSAVDAKKPTTLGELAEGIGSIFTGSKKEKPTSNIELTGFENENLKIETIEEQTYITDGNVKVNLDNPPQGVEAITYEIIEGKGRLVYKFKGGNKAIIEQGGIDGQNNIYGFSGYNNLQLQFDETEQTVKLSKEGIALSKGAKVKIGDRTFKAVAEGAFVEIIDDSHFKTNNIETQTPALKITSSEPTDLIFKNGDYSNLDNYVQAVEGNLKIKGEYITTEVLKPFESVFVDGSHLELINGKVKVRFQDGLALGNLKDASKIAQNIDSITFAQNPKTLIKMVRKTFEEGMESYTAFYVQSAGEDLPMSDPFSPEYDEYVKSIGNTFFTAGTSIATTDVPVFGKINTIQNTVKIQQQYLDQFTEDMTHEEFVAKLQEIPVELHVETVLSARAITKDEFVNGMGESVASAQETHPDLITSEKAETFQSMFARELENYDSFSKGTQFKIYQNPETDPVIEVITPSGSKQTITITDPKEKEVIKDFFYIGFDSPDDEDNQWPPEGLRKLWCERLGRELQVCP